MPTPCRRARAGRTNFVARPSLHGYRFARELHELVRDQVWLADYTVRLRGTRFEARVTVARRSDFARVVHSPGPIDEAARAQLAALGPVAVIVAPGNFHHLHVAACQRAFPDAATWICPGVERKQRALRDDGLLVDSPPPALAADFALAFVDGRFMREVAIPHRASRTLLVDLIETFEPDRLTFSERVLARLGGVEAPDGETPVDWRLSLLGRRDVARRCLDQVLAWSPERIVIAHGRGFTHDGERELRRAFRWLAPPSAT